MKKLNFYKNKISDTTTQVATKVGTLAKDKGSVLKNKTTECMNKSTLIVGKNITKAKTILADQKMMDKIKTIDLSGFEKLNFNFHHFTSVVVIGIVAFFVTFFTTGYNTQSVDASVNVMDINNEVSVFNNEQIGVEYGDSESIALIAKDMLAGVVPSSSEINEISSTGMHSFYELGEYVIGVELKGGSVLGSMPAELSIQTSATYAMKHSSKVEIALDTVANEVLNGSVYTYQLDVNIADTTAPVIELSTTDMTISDSDTWNLDSYARAIDNVDGSVTVSLLEEMDTESDGKLTLGNHYLSVMATDSTGNQSTADMMVRVKETADTSVSTESNTSNLNSFSAVGSYSGANAIYNAALAQVGRYQDCTMLVTNSLAAAGIYFHGWPNEYYSLGTVVSASQALPGDILIYPGHVAIYIGNGMAVHGGWNGNQTVIYSAYTNSGSPTFVRVR